MRLPVECSRGYLTFDERGWWIGSLGVDVPFRGAGIGRRISEAGIRLAKEFGADAINVNVRRDNIPSVNGFYRLGFRVKPGTERTYKNSGRTFINMELIL